MRQYTRFFILFSLALIVTCLAAGLNLRNEIIANSIVETRHVHADTWLENGATFEVKKLFPFFNTLELSFNPWRPGNAEPAHLKFFVCDNLNADIRVESDAVYRIPLKGSCDNRELKVEVVNPITPGGKDNRALGVQLKSAKFNSKFSFPVVSPQTILLPLAFVFFGALLVHTTFRFKKFWTTIFFVSAFYLLLSQPALEYEELKWIAYSIIAVLLGFFITKKNTKSKMPDFFYGMQREIPRSQYINGLDIIFLVLILILAASLRFYALSFGLPDNYHPDEVPKVNAVMRMYQAGDLNPRYFLHPSLLLYSTYFTNIILTFFSGNTDFAASAFYAGRLVSASAGTISVLLVFLIGRKAFSNVSGLMAAALLAVFPLHVTCSRYLKEDSLLLCLILASLYFVLLAVENNRKYALYVAGIFAGLSASTKYSGMLSVIFLISAPWLRSGNIMPDSRFLRHTFFALALMPIGFLLATPYSLITFEKFNKDFNYEKNHMKSGHSSSIDSWSQYWMYYFSRSIVPGTSYLVSLLALVAAGFLAWRGKIYDMFFVAAILLFYLPAEWIKAKPAPQPERYILPCLPFMAIVLAEFYRSVFLKHSKVFASILFALILLLPLKRTIQLASEIKSDTRVSMRTWIEENIPQGAKILVDWKAYSPVLSDTKYEIKYISGTKILEALEYNNLKDSGYDYLLMSGLFFNRYFTEPNTPAAARERIREVSRKFKTVKEVESKYGTYGFHNPKLILYNLKD